MSSGFNEIPHVPGREKVLSESELPSFRDAAPRPSSDDLTAGCVGFSASAEKGMYGELFQVWEMWPSPHSEKPVGSEVGGQDPRPWIGSPVGN